VKTIGETHQEELLRYRYAAKRATGDTLSAEMDVALAIHVRLGDILTALRELLAAIEARP